MCIYNQIIKNKKYVKNKTNKGNIPILPDRRIEYVPSKCGRCIECRKQYAREWMVRLLEHIKTNKNGKFITLTFSNESIERIINNEWIQAINTDDKKQMYPIKEMTGYARDNTIATKAVRLFTERWRNKHKKAPKHWLVTELGHNGTENIHLHGIIWTDETYEEIHKLWKYGYIWPRPEDKKQTYVNAATVKYITKYVNKQDLKHKEYKAKILASQNIGVGYINTMNAQDNEYKGRDTELTYTTTTGHKIALPTYYKKKLYTEEELERIWLDTLNKEQRFVLGKKIDISKGDKEYKRAVEEARKLNTELGYGQRPNENRKEYEELRREIMIQTRIAQAAQKEQLAAGSPCARPSEGACGDK